MAVAEVNEGLRLAQRGGTSRIKVAFYVVLIAWNAYFIGAIVYSLWMRHHPKVQSGQTDVVLSVEIYALVLGNLAIFGAGLVARRIASRRASSSAAWLPQESITR